MAILCYEITGSSQPNARSTTGAEDGHIGAVLKGDHQEASAQLYSELAANRLAMFLGIPVVVGVPARRGSEDVAMRFAALRAAEAGMDIYDFTEEDRGEDEDDDDDAEVPPGVYRNTGHVRAMSALCQKYPFEAAAIAVFDLWIGNEDRALNFKGQIRGEERGVIFLLDQGASGGRCAWPAPTPALRRMSVAWAATRSSCRPAQIRPTISTKQLGDGVAAPSIRPTSTSTRRTARYDTGWPSGTEIRHDVAGVASR